MKDDCIITKRMDLTEEDTLHTHDIDREKEFIDRSSYTHDFGEEVVNVNTQASMEWPVRHNSETDKFPFSCNGFRRAKTAHYTCTGRITRVPSRYLDTDSDSSEGSKRKAVESRLKVKRRRKSSSSNNKLLVNGFKEHNAFSLEMANIDSDRILCSLNKDEMESLADLECSEVFESPVSNDKTFNFTHETQARAFCQANINTMSPTEKNSESLVQVKVNGVLSPKCENIQQFDLKEASNMCCSQQTFTAVSVDAEDKGQARFASSNLSTGQIVEDIACDKQPIDDFKPKGKLEFSQGISHTCSSINAHLNNKDSSCDSSTNSTFVSSMEISKQSKVSCASLKDNDRNISSEKDAAISCLSSVATTSVSNGCFPSEIIATGKDGCCGKNELDLVIEDAILNRLEKKEQLVDNENGSCREDCNIKSQGLNCFRNFKMGRGYARKVNQKQMRRTTDRTNSNNSGLKKQTIIDEIKSVNKVKKTTKLQNNNLKKKNGVAQKNAKLPPKTCKESEQLDRVLGMRRSPKGDYEFLVEWTNGTSCWVSSKQIVTNKQNGMLRQYFMENDQDISVINRVPFQAYCCDSLSLKESKAVPVLKIFKKKKDVIVKPTVAKCVKKGEVFVENKEGHCYITLNRETCIRKLTCLNIVNELITALEDASVSDCDLVILRGLGSSVFGGLDINKISNVNAEETGNMILQKTRYLVQTLSNYPKPLVGLISQPAKGIGAVLLSLFDMICDEETWKKDGFIENPESERCDSMEAYCLPRAGGHSLPCEEILMGTKCLQPCEPASCEVDESDSSTVMASTLKEIESTIHKLGKTATSFLGMSGEDILKMTIDQVNNAPGCVDISEEDSGILNDTLASVEGSGCLTNSTGSVPADRYVKELESKIFEEKQLVQKYIDEISNIWQDPCDENS